MNPSDWQIPDFQLGDWRVEPRRTRIVRGKQVRPLEPRVMQVLVCLAQGSGQVITREELLDKVWNGVIVSDVALSRAISELRRGLEDDRLRPRYVETIPKVGYRLALRVTDVPEMEAPVTEGSGTDVPEAGVLSTAGGFALQSRASRRKWMVAFVMVLMFPLLSMLVIADRSRRQGHTSTLLEARPLTSMSGMEIDPSISPDGDWVAFARLTGDTSYWRAVAMERSSGRLLSLDGSREGHSERFPVFSPGGDRVALASNSGNTCFILVLPFGSDTPENEIDCSESGTIYGLDWTTDGNSLVFASRNTESGISSLQLVSLDSHVETTLIKGKTGDLFTNPRVSPDGSEIAFIRRQGSVMGDVVLIPVTGGAIRRATNLGLSLNGLSWAPDGSRVIFSSYHGSNYRLWTQDLVRGNPIRIASGFGSVSSPIVHPESGEIVFVRWNHDTNIWKISLGETSGIESGSFEPALISTQADLFPQFSPDGQTVSFVSERSGLPEVWQVDSDGSAARRLTSQGTYFTGPASLSPDSRSIVYARIDPETGLTDLFSAETDSGSTTRLTHDEANEVAPFYSHDGKWIYYGSDRSGTWKIWRRPTDNPSAEAVSVADGMIGRLRPERPVLVTLDPGDEGLLWTNMSTGESGRFNVPIDPMEDAVNWAVTSTGVWFVSRGSTGSALSFFDFELGGISSRATPRVVQRNSGLSVSPDGRQLLFTQVDGSESDLAVARLPFGY